MGPQTQLQAEHHEHQSLTKIKFEISKGGQGYDQDQDQRRMMKLRPAWVSGSKGVSQQRRDGGSRGGSVCFPWYVLLLENLLFTYHHDQSLRHSLGPGPKMGELK